MTEFDPNNPVDSHADDRWGTYCPGQTYGKNRSAWKTHSRLRDVRSAIDANSDTTVYDRSSGAWLKVYEHKSNNYRWAGVEPPGDKLCCVCESVHDYEYLYSYWSPDRDFEKVWAHHVCKRKLGVRR